MQINSINLRIDNFDNAAMEESPAWEVSRLLRELADRVEQMGVVNAMDGSRVFDSNGNTVGRCECDWESGSNDEDEEEDEEESLEVCPRCGHSEPSDGYGGNDCPECFADDVTTVMQVRTSE